MRLILLTCLILLHMTGSAMAMKQDMPHYDYSAFRLLPVAHQGRIKPLSIYAQQELLNIAHMREWHQRPAYEWLTQVIFSPETLESQYFIFVESDLRDLLKLPIRDQYRYSPAEVSTALASHQERITQLIAAIRVNQTLSSLNEKLVNLFLNLQRYRQISESFSLFRSPELAIPQAFLENISPELASRHDPSWQMLAGYIREFREAATLIAKDKGTDFTRYTPKELQLIQMVFAVEQQLSRAQQNHAFVIIPSTWERGSDWYSPWELHFNGQQSAETAKYLDHWKTMGDAWRNGNTALWAEASQQAYEQSLALSAENTSAFKLWLEDGYYRYHPLFVAIIGYLGAGFIALFWARCVHIRKWQIAAFVSSLTALSLHGGVMLLRMFILNRPPVSNLYESVLFVSLLFALLACILGWRMKRHWIVPLAHFCTAGLLIISQQLLGDDEAFLVVSAVLNTNFWLATHVICITAGYACCLLTSLLAHLYLWQKGRAGSSFTTQRDYRLHLLALASLLLTAIGTLLGGIWADQSWGRFWGWDPKENGALLIVFWLVWLLHGYIAGQIRERWYLASMAFLSVVVSLAWFGVNLLSVGLHSYGFTDAAAWGLFAFVTIESLVISILTWHSSKHA